MNEEFLQYLNRYSGGVPLLINGDAITDWCSPEGLFFRVDCNCECTWPAIVWRIIQALGQAVQSELPADLVKMASFQHWLEESRKDPASQETEELFFLEQADQNAFRSIFVQWFSNLRAAEKTVVLINDLHLLQDEETVILSWLPQELPENVGLICTTKCTEMVHNGRILGWYQAEMDTSPSLPIRPDETYAARFRQEQTKEDTIFKTQHLRIFARNAVFYAVETKDHQQLLQLMIDPDILKALLPMHWHVIRSGWMRLLLETDLDLVQLHLDLLQKLKDAGEDELMMAMARLSRDLDLRNGRYQCASITGKVLQKGSLDHDPTPYSARYQALFEEFTRMRNRRDFPRIYHEATGYLADRSLSPVERCMLIRFMVIASQITQSTSLLTHADLYLDSALRCGDVYHYHQAVLSMADALYKAKEYSESLELFENAVARCYRIGDLRSLLVSCNYLSYCYADLKMLQEAESVSRFLLATFRRMGLPDEELRVGLDLCELKFRAGDPKAALEKALLLKNSWPDQITRPKKMMALTLDSRIGSYYVEQKQYDQAEVYLLRVLKGGAAPAAHCHALEWLIKLYTRTDQINLAVQTYQTELERLFQRREYARVVQLLPEMLQFMQDHLRISWYIRLRKFWEMQLVDLRDLHWVQSFVSRMQHEKEKAVPLIQELLVAQSEHQYSKMAALAKEIAPYYLYLERRKSVSLLLAATKTELSMGEEADATAQQLLLYLMDGGRVVDQDCSREFASLPLDHDLQQIADNWKVLGEVQQHYDRVATLPELLQNQTIHGLEQAHRLREKYQLVVTEWFCDLMPLHFAALSAEELYRYIHSFPKDVALRRSIAVCDYILERMESDMSALLRASQGLQAQRLMAFYEKGAVYLALEDHALTGRVMSYLAGIYRGQKQEAHAIDYHHQAISVYDRQQRIREKLEEWNALADTYLVFGRNEEATSLLRYALSEAQGAEQQIWIANFAGKLAEQLIKVDHISVREEIDGLFELQVRTLRAAHNAMALVKALMTQVEYYIYRNSQKPLFLSKYEEVSGLVKRFRLSEEQTRLDQMAERAQRIARIYQRNTLFGIIRGLGGYHIIGGKLNEEMVLHTLCRPDPLPEGCRETVHMMLMPGLKGRLGVAVEDNLKVLPEYADRINSYIQRWNAMGAYTLELLDDTGHIQAVISLERDDEAVMLQQVRRFMSLWKADQTLLALLGTGQAEPEQCFQRKKELFDAQT